MSVRLLFVHGWAFTPAFWEPLAREMGDIPSHRLDLGFFGPERLDAPFDGDEPIVGIGHSLGLMWLLRHGGGPLAGLVSLGGFSLFTAKEDAPCGVSSTAVKAMRRGLGRNPAAVLETFHHNCATPATLCPDFATARPERLAQGLDWLLTWDLRDVLGPQGAIVPAPDAPGIPSGDPRRPGKDAIQPSPTATPSGPVDPAAASSGPTAPAVPLLALAAKDDAIVPPALTAACFTDRATRLEWLPSGGHAFPLTHAQYCARSIRAFLAELAIRP